MPAVFQEAVLDIDLDIANRALEKAGQEALTDADIENGSVKWRLVKSFYLATFLETMAKTPWTSQKRRAEMEAYEGDNLSAYAYCHKLPLDCAKPLEITDNSEFIVEGRKLYSDIESPVLVYVSNGFTGKFLYELADPQPTEDDFDAESYYTESEDGDYSPADVFEAGAVYYVIKTEDYPKYEEPELDPLLSEFIETRLAAKLVLKLTGDQQLYNTLYSESLLKEDSATKASHTQSRSRKNGNSWWAEDLGLTEA